MKAFEAKAERVQALVDQGKKLDAERAAVDAELEKIFGGSAGKKRGPKPGSKRATKKKIVKKAKARGRRAKSKDGRSINDVLVQDILPARGKEGLALADIMSALKKKGIRSTEGSIRQSLLTLANDKMALRPERGLYTLSAKGEKAKAAVKSPKAKPKKAAKKKTGKKPAKKVAKKATTKKAEAAAETKSDEPVSE